MRQLKDKRPPEFLAPIKAIPARIKAIKRLQLKGEDSFGCKHTLTYIAPKTLTLSSTNEYGKEVLSYRTDSRASLTRLPGKRPKRGKPGDLPVEAPRFAAVYLGQNSLAQFGIPNDSDFERTYEITKTVEKKRAVLRLSYRGMDSIGRDQTGVLTIDGKTGLPIGFDETQSGNSPRDDGEYSVWESWIIVATQ